MATIKGKLFILLILVGVLIALLFIWLRSSGTVQQEVKIIEKYYASDGSGKVTGITTNDVEEVNAAAKGPTCAMKFSNDRILVLDCERYLDFDIGDKAFIQYKNGKISDIRAKP